MKIRLTETELKSLIKKVISEVENLSTSYTTLNKQVLTDKKTGKTYTILPGDVWTKKVKNNTAYYKHKNGLYFTCTGNSVMGFEEEDMYSESNISKLEGSKPLFYTMKSKLCK